MINKKTISIIVPIYNAEKHLNKCINSIVNQTYNELEILLIDDGSKDSSLNICEKWSKQDSRIKVIHKENSGVSDTRNLGIEISTGDYIGFVDSDDWIEPDMFESLYNKLTENNADVADCGYVLNYPGGNEINECGNIPENSITDIKELTCYFATGGLYEGAIVTKLYKRDVIINHRFNKNISFMEDNLFCVDIAEHINKYIKYSDAKYHYYQNPASTVQSSESVNYDAIKACDILLNNPYIKNNRNAQLKMRKKRICMIFMTYNKFSSLKNKSGCKKTRKLLLEERKIWFSCGLSKIMLARLLIIYLCPFLFRGAEDFAKRIKRKSKNEL